MKLMAILSTVFFLVISGCNNPTMAKEDLPCPVQDKEYLQEIY